MRVTAETKAATRRSLLVASRKLFRQQGFEQTTTRDIARAADVAHGTLFNYFADKEAVLSAVVSDAVSAALAKFQESPPAKCSLEESLFSLVALQLRQLKTMRKLLPALVESLLSPLAGKSDEAAMSVRLSLLDAATQLAIRHGYGELSSMALQLLWTLFTGILIFWANDTSPKQEDTLALIDHSLAMFVGWLDDARNTSTGSKKKQRRR
ncbi:MAG: TetR/AcrR family transcriptional regulator [Pirellulaceae bacterium]|nr:TetR/AcrR family transcriptional regulator [Planctomycetales bacterium]